MRVETLFTLTAPKTLIDVREWSVLLGIEPLGYCLKGDPIGINISGRLSPDSFWTYGISAKDDISITYQLKSIISVLFEKRDVIKSLVEHHGLDIECSTFVWKMEDGASIEVDSSLISMMSDLGLSWNIKFY